MISQVEKLGRSLAIQATGHLEWMDRKAKANHEAALKDGRTLEVCLACCAILFALALWSGKALILIKPICALAGIAVVLKLLQLALLARAQAAEHSHG